MRKTLLGLTAFAAIATPLALATAAKAATLDAAGTGFVGKGEVQSAFGWNNKAAAGQPVQGHVLRRAADHPGATQGVRQTGVEHNFQFGVQSATQTGTQAGTQVVAQDLTCTYTNGNGTQTFHREGVRDGDRTGTREGTREGQRTVAPPRRAHRCPHRRAGWQAGRQDHLGARCQRQ